MVKELRILLLFVEKRVTFIYIVDESFKNCFCIKTNRVNNYEGVEEFDNYEGEIVYILGDIVVEFRVQFVLCIAHIN